MVRRTAREAGDWRRGIPAALTVLCVLTAGACTSPEKRIQRSLAEARELKEEGRINHAIQILEASLARNPGRLDVMEALAFARARLNDHPAAAFLFAEIADADPARRDYYLLAGKALFTAGDYAGAESLYRRYAEHFPDDTQGWRNLGEVAELQGHPQSAVQAYLAWNRIQPNPEAAHRLGNLFIQLNNPTQARNWLRTAARQDDDVARSALLALLQLNMQEGNMEGAGETIAELDRRFPAALDESAFHQYRRQVEQWKASREELEAVLARQREITREITEARIRPPPEEPVAEEPAEETPEPAERAVDPEPVHEPVPAAPPRPAAPAALTQARDARDAGRWEEAVGHYWRALASDDSLIDAWLELAESYRSMRRPTEAESCLLEAVRRAPDSESVRIRSLSLLREIQTHETYLRELEAARHAFPGNLNLIYDLAQAYATRTADGARAASAYRDFLNRSDPGDPRRNEASEFLQEGGWR